MLSFIRKRFPSMDRSNEHKSKHIGDEYQDNEMKRTQSSNELNEKKNKKKKKKDRYSSTLDGLIVDPNPSSTVNQINTSYSDVEYFTMMPSSLSQSINHDKTSTNRDSLLDSYLNPSDVVQTRVFQVPVIDCRKEQQIFNSKDVNQQRSEALKQVIEQQTQKRSVK